MAHPINWELVASSPGHAVIDGHDTEKPRRLFLDTEWADQAGRELVISALTSDDGHRFYSEVATLLCQSGQQTSSAKLCIRC